MAFFRFLFCFSNVVCECPPNLAIYLFTCLVDLSPGHGVLPAYLSSCLLTYRPIPVYTNLRTYLSTHPKPLHVYHPADLSKEYIYLSTNLLYISAGLLVYFSTLFPTNLTYILYYTCLHFYFIWIYVCLLECVYILLLKVQSSCLYCHVLISVTVTNLSVAVGYSYFPLNFFILLS